MLVKKEIVAFALSFGWSVHTTSLAWAQEETAVVEQAAEAPARASGSEPKVEAPAEAPADVKEEATPAAIAIPAIRLAPAARVIRVEAAPIQAIELQPAAVVQGAAVAIATEAVDQEKTDDSSPQTWIKLFQNDWRYWDQADAPPANWLANDFDDSSWSKGDAILGYGDQDVKTKLSFGDNADAKPLIAYFRFTFELAELPAVSAVAGRLICDDGAVVYLNGKEIYRQNLPEGELTRESTAKVALSDGEERVRKEFLGDPAAPLLLGKNVIGVQVHQVNASSSDIALALQLRGVDEQEAAKVRDRMERGAEAQVQAEAAQLQQQQLNEAAQARTYIHLMDGTVTYATANGQTQTQHSDALEQIASFAPQTHFARAMEGDTLAKLSRQHNIPLDRLAMLNRRSADRPFADNEIFCLSWTYTVTEKDTLAKVAQIFVTSREKIAELNGLSVDAELKAGQVLQVPGEFTYHHQGDNSYIQLAQYAGVQQAGRNMPYNPESQQIKREQVPEAQSLSDFAKTQNVTAKQLATMNGLEEDAKLEKGQWMLIEFSVEANEGATVAQIAAVFNLDEERMRLANNLDEGTEPQAGQRLQIPIGELMNRTTGSSAGSSQEETSILEVRLGDLQ